MLRTIGVVMTAVMLGGCVAGQGSRDYTRDQARQAQEVEMGVVEGIRPIKIEGTKSAIGPAAGAAVGGVLGNTVGDNGSIVGAVLGAVAGGLAGAAVEEGVTRQDGFEITVRLDSGRTMAISQGADETFTVGERVRVLTGGGVMRVTH